MRKISSLLAIWAVMIMAMPTFANTRLQDDLITIGKPGSTANKRIKLGSQEIRSNTATSKLEYTHDGVTYKPIGSGSGAGGSSGGINLIANESFEDPITTGWSNTGGTFTQESYLNGTETDAKFARFVATAAGQYFETPLITVPTNFSGGCEADFKKISVSGNDLFKLEILDSSSNVLATGNIKQSSWVKFPTIGTTCPTPGSQFRLRVTSLAAGTIDLDYGYLGSNQNIVTVSTSLENVVFKRQSSFATTINTYSTIPLDETSDATRYPLSSNCFTIKKTGKYSLRIAGNFLGNNESVNLGYTVNGASVVTTTTAHIIDTDGAGARGRFFDTFYASFNSNDVVCAKYKHNSTVVRAGDLVELELKQIEAAPQEQAVNTDQASWFIDANIGGANPDLGLAAVTSYSEITNASLDMVLNSGSSSAKIPCSGTNSPTGLTCAAGSESVGVVMNIPYAGSFEVCMDFTHDFGIQPNGDAGATFQLVETALNSNAIIQEGKTRVSTRAQQGASSVQQARATPFRLCGNFNFTSAGEKAIRLMYEQGIGGTIFSSVIYGDRSSSQGQRDIRITAYPRLSAYNRPILLDSPIVTASYWLSANFTASTTIPINFNSKEFDSHDAVTVSPTAWKFTAPKSGTYSIVAVLPLAVSASGYVKVYKNGSSYKTIGFSPNSVDVATVATTIKLSQGDYIDIRPDASLTYSGGTINGSSSNISITRLGL